VDPGSATAGFGVVDLVDGRLRHVASGRIVTRGGSPLGERLRVIHDELAALVRDLRPDAVAIESLFFARNVRSALVLAHGRGVALLAAAEARLPVAEYAPMEVKQATVGYGRAAKAQVQAMVARLLALPEPPPPDAADALSVAICHANRADVGDAVERVVADGSPAGRRSGGRGAEPAGRGPREAAAGAPHEGAAFVGAARRRRSGRRPAGRLR
jgi:crossover junction endodeoxyribonuclease RuvC